MESPSITKQIDLSKNKFVLRRKQLDYDLDGEPMKISNHRLQRRFFKKMHKNHSSISSMQTGDVGQTYIGNVKQAVPYSEMRSQRRHYTNRSLNRLSGVVKPPPPLTV